MWPDLRSALHLHRVSKLVYCKVNLHLIDARALTAQDWSDMLEVLSEGRLDIIGEDARELIEPELAVGDLDSEPNLQQVLVSEWNEVEF
jgi:hypothetical protein